MSYDLGLESPVVARGEAPSAALATIANHTYHGYDGPFKSRSLRWWIIALATIRANVNKTRYGFWIPAALIAISYLILGVAFYFTQTVRAQIEAQGYPMAGGDANPYANQFYGDISNGVISLLTFIAALVVGSASIAADNRANALLVYLSKPITRFDYLFGKWMGVFALLAALNLVPSLLLYLFFAGTYASEGFLTHNPTLILRVLLASALPALLHASLIIGFSAWTKSVRMAGASYAAFYLILRILTLALGASMWKADKKGEHQARTQVVLYASVDGVRDALAQRIYAVHAPAFTGWNAGGRRRRRRRAAADAAAPPRHNAPPRKLPEWPPLWAILAIGGAYVLVPLAAAQAKVRAVEVVRG